MKLEQFEKYLNWPLSLLSLDGCHLYIFKKKMYGSFPYELMYNHGIIDYNKEDERVGGGLEMWRYQTCFLSS